MKMEFSAGGLVYRKKGTGYQFALIQDSNDQWTLPKGHIEKGEKPETAALRETTEEIGLHDLRIIELLEKSDYWFKFRDDLIHKFVYFYLMENTTEEELSPQLEEINNVQWFGVEDAIQKIDYKKQNLALLLKACDKLHIPCQTDGEKLK